MTTVPKIFNLNEIENNYAEGVVMKIVLNKLKIKAKNSTKSIKNPKNMNKKIQP